MKNLEEFGLSSWDKVVVKVGSNILAWNSDWINHDNIANIVDSVDYLMWIGLNVILVSSWAVAVWKNNHKKIWIDYEDDLSKREKAYLFKNGWASLLWTYIKLFEAKWILTGWNLLTHDNFRNEEELKHIKETWDENVKNRTLDIINENDVVSREELWFSDNDELSWFVAEAFWARVLILLSDINWLYKDFNTDNQSIIDSVNNINDVRTHSVDTKNFIWTWMMDSKLNVMEKMIKSGIIWILANGWKKNIIQDIFEWKTVDKTIFRNNFYIKELTKQEYLDWELFLNELINILKEKGLDKIAITQDNKNILSENLNFNDVLNIGSSDNYDLYKHIYMNLISAIGLTNMLLNYTLWGGSRNWVVEMIINNKSVHY